MQHASIEVQTSDDAHGASIAANMPSEAGLRELTRSRCSFCYSLLPANLAAVFLCAWNLLARVATVDACKVWQCEAAIAL